MTFLGVHKVSICNLYSLWSHPRQSKAYSFTGKKILGGGQLSHHVFCVEGCLRLQNNIGLRPINGRNATMKLLWCKWAFIWVFCIGNTRKCHFLAYICYFEHFKMVLKYLSWVKLISKTISTFWEKNFTNLTT